MAKNILCDWLGFCCGKQQMIQYVFYYFANIRWFSRIQWIPSRRLFRENTISSLISSMFQPFLKKTQDGQWPCSGGIKCSPAYQQPNFQIFRYPTFRKEMTFLFGTERSQGDLMAKLKMEISSAEGYRRNMMGLNMLPNFRHYQKHCHRQNVTSHHSFSLIWQFWLSPLDNFHH